MRDELAATRRQLAAIHNELRNAGLNPIEALTCVASVLSNELTTLDKYRLPSSTRQRLLVLRSEWADSGLLANLYQEFLLGEARNGLGQYLTPLPVAEFVAKIATTRAIDGIAVDPFCGSGLLLDCLAQRAPDLKLIGIEINEPVANLAEALSTATKRSLDIRRADAFLGLAEGGLPQADLIVTNPPFGATATTADLTSLRFAGVPESLLTLGKWPAELLGLEVCLRILRPNGLLIAVLPQSVITNNRWAQYRCDLFSRLSVEAIVSLPEATFMPFRGVAKACILVGSLAARTLPYDVRYYRSRSIGYNESGRTSGPCDLDQIASYIQSNKSDERIFLDPHGGARTDSLRCTQSDGVRLGDVAEIIRGKNPPASYYTNQGPILLKVGDLAGSLVSWRSRDRNHVPVDWFQKHHHLHLRVGDICLTSAGHRPRYIGLKVDLLDEIPPCGAMPSGEVMVVRLRPDSGIDPAVLLFYLRSAEGYGQIQDIVRGSTGHLYPKDLAELRLPPLDQGISNTQVSEAFSKAAHHFREYLQAERTALLAAGWTQMVDGVD